MASVRRRQVDLSVLDRLTDGFTGFLDALVQLVENSDDWGADRIILRFFWQDGVLCLACIDNGSGMGPDLGQEAYVTLAGSEARKDVEKKGRNGTGRLGFIHHCEEAETITKTGSGNAYRITLTRPALFDAWFTTDGSPLKWTKTDLPYGHDLTTSGTMVVWRNIGVGNPSAKMQRKPENVIENLAERLSPHLAPKIVVQVFDEQGRPQQEQPLKPRKINGDPIQMIVQNDPPVGDIHCDLYVVARADRSADHVMVGAKGPVCTWSEFVSEMLRDRRYAMLARQVDIVLRHPQVVGHVDVPALNKAYATGNRKSFSAKLLDDEDLVFALLESLRLSVVPRVEKELGLRSDQIVTTSDTELIRRICETLQSSGSVGKPEKKTVAHLTLNRHRIAMRPGDRFTFAVEKPDPAAAYVWDDSACGGALDRKQGSEVTYTAREVGNHTLTVRVMGDVDEAPFCTVQIMVREKIAMSFTKSRVNLAWNDTHVVRLQFVPEGADLDWRHQDWGGTLLIHEDDPTQAEVRSGEENGDFDITVVNLNNPDEDVAVCTVHIERDWAPEPRQTITIDNQIVVNGHTFEIVSTKITKTADAHATVSWLHRGASTDRTVIMLNFGHPLFLVESDLTRTSCAIREIACRVAQSLYEGQGSKAVDEQAATLTANMLSKALATGKR